jgi:hypothetical protein
MTLEKAIETIEQRIDKPLMDWCVEDFRALQLGIEALKEVKRLRSYKAFYVQKLLPGEADEHPF